jgi:twitching motility protein PilT
MRIIPFHVPSFDDLQLPAVVRDIALEKRGLILVTGAAGVGKSWTLAAIINHINENRKCHVITIEDPIEFLHKDNLSAINQREVGVDTDSFANAFRAALRQDPNVILVGELRDTITMDIALRAAATGHLVLSTLHTNDAKETISRLIDSFPPHQQKQVRLQIASNLYAVISQRLLERADGEGRVVAAEIMIVTAAIKGHILVPYKTEQIQENMSKGKDQYGMQTFDQALLELVLSGQVHVSEALKYASSPNDFKLQISLGANP